jgi:predicted permease
MRRLLRRLRYWLKRRDLEEALHEELEFHRAMKQQELEADGLAPDDALFASRREMGNVTLAREDARAAWIWPWLESVWQDARLAVRSLLRQPGFTLLSVVVLGVAIGLNVSLFTVFAGAALRPMAGVADPARLAVVSGRVRQVPNLLSGLSFPEFKFLAAGATTAELAAERQMPVTFDGGNGASDISARFVTGNYFDLLGPRMQLGRGIRADDDTGSASALVVVLSHALWQVQFGGDPSIIGRSVRVANQPHTVIGVVSREFSNTAGRSRLWLPVTSLSVLRSDDIGLDRPDACCFEVYARLDTGVTREQLETELHALSSRFRASAGQEARPIVVGGTQVLRGRRGDSSGLAVIGVLFLAITMVLLLACANVGNLLLARAVARRGEIGVRLSLGAGRWRVVRQLLTEGLVLALLAAAAGLAVAAWLPRVVLNDVIGQPAPFDIDLDGLVFAYAAVLAAIACLASALAPALHATHGGIAATLKDRALARARLPLRSLLLGLQVAVTVVLLASAGLLLRGVEAARDLDLGFRIDDIIEVNVRLPQPDYNAERIRILLPDLSAALDSAGLTSVALAAPGRATEEARLPGEGSDQTRPIDRFDVSPSYFSVLDIPIVAGRGFVDGDQDRSPAIVNETLARQLWRGENALGRSLVADNRTLEVIGIVRDARLVGLDPVPPIVFQPLTGPRGNLFPTLLVQRGQPTDTAAVSDVIERLEPRAQVTVAPMRNRLEFQIAELALAPLAASVLGLLALGLATVGMFGFFGYIVRQRTREIGIRIALGARSGEIIRLVVAGSSRPLIVGLVVGLFGAFGASQLLRSVLYGVNPIDPITYGAAASLLTVAALAASCLPARRAARLNPTQALREQ